MSSSNCCLRCRWLVHARRVEPFGSWAEALYNVWAKYRCVAAVKGLGHKAGRLPVPVFSLSE